MSKFLVIDGMDGSGKGTQLALLKEYLASHGIDAVFTREPGGCPEAEIIRERILHDTTLSEQQRFDLVWEARALHVNQTILPARKAGTLVVCDRFDSSTWAYQICAGEHPDLKSEFNRLRSLLVTEVCPPDLYVVFDLEPEVSRGRVMGDGTRAGLSIMDQKPVDYYALVRGGFREFATTYPVAFVQADQTPEEVFQSFLSVLKDKGFF